MGSFPVMPEPDYVKPEDLPVMPPPAEEFDPPTMPDVE